MRRLAACFVLSLALSPLAPANGFAKDATIGQSPVESKSRFCEDGNSLYRVGGVLFCADPETQWAPRFTYSVTGNATKTFDRQIRDVIAVAHCLTGRSFEQVADGQFKITIDNKVEPPDKNGGTYSGAANWNAHFNVLGFRSGSTHVNATNAAPAGIGAALEGGLWKFLGLARPRPIALASFAFAAPSTSAPIREVFDGARSCEKGANTLFQTDDAAFCAPLQHEWPTATGYAVVGDTAGFEAAVTRVADFVGRLGRVRFEASAKPNLVVILTERELTNDSLAALLAASHVEPKEEGVGRGLEFAQAMRHNTMERIVGKPITSVIANFMSTSSSTYSHGQRGGPTGASTIGLHNRSRVDTESNIQESFLDLLEIKLPAYQLPETCEASFRR